MEFYDEMLRCGPYREWGGIATVHAFDLNGRVDGQAVKAIEGFVAPQFCSAHLIYRFLGRIRSGRRVH